MSKKKLLYSFFAIALCFTVFTRGVNATISIATGADGMMTCTSIDGTNFENCELKITVNNGSSRKYLDFELLFENSSFESFEAASGYHVETILTGTVPDGEDYFPFSAGSPLMEIRVTKEDNSNIENINEQLILTIKVKKTSTDPTAKCIVGVSFIDEVRTCEIVNGNHFDSKGNIVSEEDYNKDCFSCRVVGSDYYNKKGVKVTAAEYAKDCNPKCEKKDGKYYDENGIEVSKEEFENNKKCNPPTGSTLPMIALISLAGVGAVATVIAYNKKKLFKL